MALDYGEARIGVAVSDAAGISAHARDPLEPRPDGSHFRVLVGLCEELEVARVLVGLPVHLSGEEGASARAARSFAATLQDLLDIPVELVDERLTTAQAEKILIGADVSRRRRREVVDGLAAVLLLNAYLASSTDRDSSREHED